MEKDCNRWGSYQHFEKVLRKKQNLQKIAADVIDMTDDEIMSIDSQPRWIREHLIRYRDRNNGGGLLPDEIAAEMVKQTSVDIGVVLYETYIYVGQDTLVGKMSMELKHGDHILIINSDKYQIKINHDVETLREEDIDLILDNSNVLGDMSLYEFRATVSKYLEEKYFNVDKCDMGEPDVSDPYSMTNIFANGVRIDR
jgi:hypothetical protein